ncbi:MAG: YihY/virulence factor BrkB family protein [Bacteroidales bacterium]|nr:YihY/virulence factor BrkB family protein [Bacteroidales bacterium]
MSDWKKRHINPFKFLEKYRFYRVLLRWGRRVTLPGFRGMPIYDVVQFFFRGIRQSSLLARANSLSFTFTLAIFPMILFFFTIIPYIPVDGLQDSILSALYNVMPEQVYGFLEKTITEIVSKQSGGWLSLGFFMAFYFSNSGVIGIMKAFNRSAHTMETRSWFKMHLVSLGIQLILITIIIIAAALLILTPVLLNYISDNSIITNDFTLIMISIAKWVILGLLMFLSLSVLFYLAPAGKRVFRFFSPGSTLATLLALVFIALFNLYIDNFARYNELYGSIGTIIILMLYININAIALLIGFELNASIYDAHKSGSNTD